MIDHTDIPLLKELIRVSIGASTDVQGPHITGGLVQLAWGGFGPVTVLPDGNDPNAADQGLVAVQPLVGCDNWLPVGARVLILHLGSGSFVIGRPNGSSDTWHYFGDPNNGTLHPSWQDGSTLAALAGEQRVGYRRTAGLVMLCGSVQRTSHDNESIIAYLPADYAPAAVTRFAVRCGALTGNLGGVKVDSSGQLTYEFGPMGIDGYDPSGAGAGLLDGLTFPLG